MPSASSLEDQNIRRALRELQENHVGRALAALSSKGVLPLTPEVRGKLLSKYPADPKFAPPAAPPSHASVPTLSAEALVEVIKQAASTKGAGHDGWSWAHLQDILALAATKKHGLSDQGVAAGLAAVCNDIACGHYTTDEGDMWEALSTSRGIALTKVEGSTDPRPIGIPTVWVSLTLKAFMQTAEVRKHREDNDLVGPWQLGCGVSGGSEALANIVRGYLVLHPERAALKADIKNAFNEVSRARVMELSKHMPQIAPLLHLLYGRPGGNKVVYQSHDGTEPLVCRASKGVTQGGVEAPFVYAFAHRPAVDNTMAAHQSLTAAGQADDTYFMDAPLPLLLALSTYKVELAKLGETLQLSKCQLTLGPAVPPESMSAILEASSALGVQVVPGFLAGGIPVGTVAFVESELAGLFSEAKGVIDLLGRATASVHSSSNCTSVQGIYKIMRWCMAPAKVNHLLRGLPSTALQHHVREYDKQLYLLLLQLLNVPASPDLDPNTVKGALLMDKVHLPARQGGLGLGSAAKTADAARRGNLALTASIVATTLAKGGGFDVERDGKTVLPELFHLFDPATINPLGIEALPGAPPASYFTHQGKKLSHIFNVQANAALEKSVRARMNGDPQAAASFLSGGGGGCHLLAHHLGSGQDTHLPRVHCPGTCQTGPPCHQHYPYLPHMCTLWPGGRSQGYAHHGVQKGQATDLWQGLLS
jgi:hypothetical protein